MHPEDRTLLGMKWRGRVLADKVLPFGLRSVPITFTAFADALQWLMQTRGEESLFHYVDDFITVGKPDSPECGTRVRRQEPLLRRTSVKVQQPLFLS